MGKYIGQGQGQQGGVGWTSLVSTETETGNCGSRLWQGSHVWASVSPSAFLSSQKFRERAWKPKGSALTPAHLRICFLETLGPETFQTGAEADPAVFPLEYTGPTRSPPCLPKKDTCSPPPPHSAWQCSLHSLTWTLLLSDLLSNCYFVMSCVSLLKKRAESNLGAGSICIFFSGLGHGGRELPPRASKVGEGGELVLELWPPAQNEAVAAYSLPGLGEGQIRVTQGPPTWDSKDCPTLGQ